MKIIFISILVLAIIVIAAGAFASLLLGDEEFKF